MAKRRVGSIQAELLSKSREAALNAVQTFNNPLTTFKTETFIVLMVIAWMYLLHAHYRQEGVDYRYFDQKPKRRRFQTTKAGAQKYWELERCLNEDHCPLDPSTKSNLRFLIGLRHEIEHHKSAGVDDQLAGRYLACCLNYERTVTELFGPRFSLGSYLTFALQFRDLTEVPDPTEASEPVPANVAKYIQEFDANLPDEEFESPFFKRKFLFVPVVTSKRGQADRVIEFISADSELAQAVNKEYRVLREVERPKYLRKQILAQMKKEGFVRFSPNDHTLLWKEMDAKNPGKGFGVKVGDTWYWYDRWFEVVRKHCEGNAKKYMAAPALEAAS